MAFGLVHLVGQGDVQGVQDEGDAAVVGLAPPSLIGRDRQQHHARAGVQILAFVPIMQDIVRTLGGVAQA
ncbi:hypothetical protein V8F63_02460 [Brevundimonas sp. LF-1]